MEAYKRQQAHAATQLHARAATKIQALLRGVRARLQFKKNLPILKRERRQRAFCIECEMTAATRRCRQCGDKFCAECYELLHSKGKRKGHSWVNITPDPRVIAMNYESTASAGGKNGKKKGGTGGDGDVDKDKTKATNKKKTNNSQVGGQEDERMEGKATPHGKGSLSNNHANANANANASANTGNKMRTAMASMGAASMVHKSDWEEFYDASARAKYWYNKQTGEASWINPFQ